MRDVESDILRQRTAVGENLFTLLYSTDLEPRRKCIWHGRAKTQRAVQRDDRPGVGAEGAIGQRQSPALAERVIGRQAVCDK